MVRGIGRIGSGRSWNPGCTAGRSCTTNSWSLTTSAHLRLLSICSRVLPFVSGTRSRTKKKPQRQIAPYTQNVPAGPTSPFKKGKVNVKTNDAIQSAETDMETARPRMRLGKISDIRTHVTGASDNA